MRTARTVKAKGRWMKVKDREALRKAIADAGLSIRGLARAAQPVDERMIRKLLNGEKTSCTPALAIRICRALRLETTEPIFVTMVSSPASQTACDTIRRAA